MFHVKPFYVLDIKNICKNRKGSRKKITVIYERAVKRCKKNSKKNKCIIRRELKIICEKK